MSPLVLNAPALQEVTSATGVFSLIAVLIGLPLLGAAVLLLGGRRTNKWGPYLGVLTVAASSVILPQPSSTSSSKPPLPPTLTNVFLFYCCVLFRCHVVSPSSSGGHPAHRIRHPHRRCRPSS